MEGRSWGRMASITGQADTAAPENKLRRPSLLHLSQSVQEEKLRTMQKLQSHAAPLQRMHHHPRPQRRPPAPALHHPRLVQRKTMLLRRSLARGLLRNLHQVTCGNLTWMPEFALQKFQRKDRDLHLDIENAGSAQNHKCHEAKCAVCMHAEGLADRNENARAQQEVFETG